MFYLARSIYDMDVYIQGTLKLVNTMEACDQWLGSRYDEWLERLKRISEADLVVTKLAPPWHWYSAKASFYNTDRKIEATCTNSVYTIHDPLDAVFAEFGTAGTDVLSDFHSTYRKMYVLTNTMDDAVEVAYAPQPEPPYPWSLHEMTRLEE